ncbi:serine/threonine protein kinase [Nocardioides oleivorans]|uniref:non-specific serine/threonine protein kinase n=1 Tax=Nocardioides oleivorans TaxID=273676 RepID=A0A4Q2RXS9_9ACTN|nr:serine/threonine-protein kinase [Nocardioides oleivorans]RYB94081.1 serine/threonine protein kinase [Nocardioides oleivorans]
MSVLAPGAAVDEARRYVLDSRIATGGMGEVWAARDTLLDRPVAVKVLKAEYADDPLFRTRFETEAQHAAALQHPGIASVYDYGDSLLDDGSAAHRPFLVMELVDGQPLSNLLRPSAPLDPDATRELLALAADALGVAHAAGIVHRDVKPANLLVTPDRRIKVTDFGIARAADGMALTETGQVLGTPAYISPEQAEGGTATAASDVYSLAVVAFECLAGEKPFVAATPVATAIAHLRNPVPDLPGSVPADLARVVRRALSKAPEDRYADGTAFAAALRDPGADAGVAPVAAVPAAAADATQVIPTMAPAAEPAPVPTPVVTPVATPPVDDAQAPRRTTPWSVVLGLVTVVVAVLLVAIWLGTRDSGSPSDETPSESPSRSESPRESPSDSPSDTPTESPSDSPSQTPTESPTETPSESPSQSPTESPTPTPTETPTETPSESPTTPTPTETPTASPTESPTTSPAATPSSTTTPAGDGLTITTDGEDDQG